MSTIVTRAGKGSPLTWTEVDANFTNLNSDKLQSGNTAAALTITSATINGGIINDTTIGASSATTGKFTSLTSTALTSGRVTYAGTGGLLQDSANLVFTGTNLGLGISSPTTSVGSTLHINDSTSQGSQLHLTDSATSGSAATDGGIVMFAGNELYLWNQENSFMSFGTNNTERMRIDYAGNVGIGTSSPSTKLDVNGDLTVATSSFNTKFTNPIGNGGIAFNASTDPTTVDQRIFSLGFGSLTYNAQARLEAFAAEAWTATNRGSYLRFSTTSIASTSPTERMRIDSAGNVGIGTTSPNVKLEIAGSNNGITTGTATNTLRFYDTDTSSATNQPFGAIEFYGADTSNPTMRAFMRASAESATVPTYLSFGTATAAAAAVEQMRLDSSGNLGLVVTPSAWNAGKAIEVGGVGASIWNANNAGDIFLTSNVYYNSGFKYAATNASSYYEQNAGVHKWAIAPSGTAGNAITFTQAMTLDTSGNLLVGTTSATSGGAKLQTVDGITFPATQVASANANTLDDYEEGTYTPTISGSTTAGTGTYGSRTGVYTKIGNTVYFYAYINWTAHTGTGNLLLSALPFTSSNTSNLAPVVNVVGSTLTFTNQLYASVAGNTTYAELRTMSTGAATAAVAMDTAATIIVTGFYYI